MNSSCTDVAIGGIGKCRGACAGGLRSVVAATAQPAGTARKSGQDNGPGGELLALLRGFVFDGWFSAFRPVGQRRCKQRPSNHCVKQSSSAVAATTERSPPAQARGAWPSPLFHSGTEDRIHAITIVMRMIPAKKKMPIRYFFQKRSQLSALSHALRR